jgi:tetratricopeptide (TPR) repeat protein
MSTEPNDVLEQNVSTLIESGGEPPKMSDIARARIKNELVAKHGREAGATKSRARTPLIAAGIGIAATAATAMIVAHFAGTPSTKVEGEVTKKGLLADGSTYIAEQGAKVTVLGPRRVKVEGAALLDVAPGKGTFVVETGHGKIEVLGTRFLVAADAARTTAAVVRGSVKLSNKDGNVTLHAGEQAVAEPGRPPTRGPAPRLSHLVSWAQQARRKAETDLEPLHHGTLYARDPGVRWNGTFGEQYPLPMKQLTVDVVVEDQVARVALDQTFHNDTNRTLEGVYKFAIPPDASLQRLAMYVDGKLTESAVVERMRARRIYEELVYRRIDPGLLEYAGSGRLNLRVYPLPANQDKRMMVAYTQSLPKLYSDWTLAIPMPEIDQPVADYVVSARIKGCANCELTSPSHEIAVERSGEDAIVKYHRMAEKIGDTFVVHVRDSRKQTTYATHAEGSDHYMMVRAPADVSGTPREYKPRTWVILDDVSASRSQIELKAQQDLVDAFLRELDEDDKVSIVAFDVQARVKLAPTRVLDVDRKVVRKALSDEGGVGATDFQAALDLATKTIGSAAGDDAFVVYLGDGVITSGPRQLDALRAKLAGKAHFIGVGVGDGPDTQTLQALAGATGGYSTTIDLSDDVGWRAFDLIAALHTSRVTGIEARLVDAQGQLVPSTLYLRSPQLADGEEIEAVAKLASDATPAAIELTGTRDGKPWTQKVALAAPTDATAAFLPRLWAQQHISARLLAKHEPVIVPPCTPKVATRTEPAVSCPTEAQLRDQRDEEIRKEVVTLGKQYFLLSRHTSLLVLENDAMYAKYGVRKGAGDTWAPYAMPAKIDVVTTAPTTAMPSNVADDAELVRSPLQIFYTNQYSYNEEQEFGWDAGGATANPLGGFGTIGHGSGTGQGFGVGRGGGGTFSGPAATLSQAEAKTEETRSSLGLDRLAARDDDAPLDESNDIAERVMRKESYKAKKPGPVMDKRGSISSRELLDNFNSGSTVGRVDLRRRHNKGGYRYGAPNYLGAPQHFNYPGDVVFDDLSAFIPALVPDSSDTWRAELTATSAGPKAYPIDEAAKTLLAKAHDALPAGVYHWGDLDIAVDSAHRFGWKRETETGLGESAAFDGKVWSRRYAELGVSVTRPIVEDDIALAFAYLPIWIADPAHYAHYFTVRSKNPREVELRISENGKERIAYVLAFDDRAHLTAIHDSEGVALIEITWGATGPTAMIAGGDQIAIGFTADSIPDVTQWAHGATQPGVVVELPGHLPAYWKTQIEKSQPGDAAWRNAQRQLMVSAAALQDRNTVMLAYQALLEHGGVEKGDLALGSSGVVAGDDKQVAAMLAPFAKDPLAKYLLAGRAYSKNQQKYSVLEPQSREGQVGALWTLRYASALLYAENYRYNYDYYYNPKPSKEGKLAADELMTLGQRAFMLRLAGAAMLGQHYTVDVKDAVRVWDTVALGDYKNVVAAQVGQLLYSRGQYDQAAERFAKLAAEIDLSAMPANMQYGQYAFQNSRRGQAGWQLTYALYRDRVLAGSSFEHVLALLPLANQHAGDNIRVLGRALELTGNNTERRLAVAQIAIQFNQPGLANQVIEPMLTSDPSRELYQLAASQALAQSRPEKALELFEKAQDAGADEEVDLNTVRSELNQIITLCQQLAIQRTGADRDKYIKRALTWGRAWRLIDPDNDQIDNVLGQLLLSVGDTEGAWRQLSSAIERDPWAGTGYATVADTFEREGKVAEALELWQQAIVIDQTNPTHRLRKAQALIALGREAEGDALLKQITTQKWHDIWAGTVSQAQSLIDRGKQAK